MFKKIRNFIENRKTLLYFLKELLITQKEMINSIKSLSETQRLTNRRLNVLSLTKEIQKKPIPSVLKMIQNFLYEKIGLHIRKIHDSEAQENEPGNVMKLDCIDMNEVSINVFIFFYNNLSEEEIERINNTIKCNKSKLVFYAGSVSVEGRDLIEKTGMYLIESSKYYPGQFDLN